MERISYWLAAVLAALMALFCAMNWPALTAESALNFGVMQVQAPMGVIMLTLMAAFAGVLLLVLLYSRIGSLRETRALHRDLRTAHDVAERAESSRFEGLQHLVVTEFRMLNERITALDSTLAARDAKPDSLVKLL